MLIRLIYIFNHAKNEKSQRFVYFRCDWIMEHFLNNADVIIQKRLKDGIVKMVLTPVALVIKEKIFVIQQNLTRAANQGSKAHMVQIGLVILLQLPQINPKEQVIFVFEIVVKGSCTESAVAGYALDGNALDRVLGEHLDGLLGKVFFGLLFMNHRLLLKDFLSIIVDSDYHCNMK